MGNRLALQDLECDMEKESTKGFNRMETDSEAEIHEQLPLVLSGGHSGQDRKTLPPPPPVNSVASWN